MTHVQTGLVPIQVPMIGSDLLFSRTEVSRFIGSKWAVDLKLHAYPGCRALLGKMKSYSLDGGYRYFCPEPQVGPDCCRYLTVHILRNRGAYPSPDPVKSRNDWKVSFHSRTAGDNSK